MSTTIGLFQVEDPDPDMLVGPGSGSGSVFRRVCFIVIMVQPFFLAHSIYNRSITRRDVDRIPNSNLFFFIGSGFCKGSDRVMVLTLISLNRSWNGKSELDATKGPKKLMIKLL